MKRRRCDQGGAWARYEKRVEGDVHLGEGSVDRGTPDLDRDGGVEDAYGGLERLKAEVLVGEDTVLAIVDAEGDTDRNVVLVGAEPGIALGLLEDVVEEGVVAVVVHGGRATGGRGGRTTWLRKEKKREGEGNPCGGSSEENKRD